MVDQSPDLLLDSSAGGTSWAVYSLNTAGTYAVNLKMEFSSPGDPGAWLAVANFDRGHWQFEPMYTSSPAEIPISLNHAADYISPLGNFYFAALSYDDLDVVVNSLTVELAEAPPPTFKISGNISDGSNPLAGIQVGLEPGGLSATTNLSGNYSFSGLLAGNYTLTPTDSGYEFAPLNRNAVITDANLTGQDFTGTVVQPPVTYVDDIAPLLAGSTGESSCTGCHGGISPNLESYAQVSANANLIKTEVNLSSGGMPPGGPQWSQANRDLFQAWIDGGKIEQ